MSHTPGPWTVGGKYAFKTVLLNARGESIASGGNNRAIQGPVLEASLRLAAAAPDLLAALEEMIELRSATMRSQVPARDEREIVRDALAAIAKAKGEA